MKTTTITAILVLSVILCAWAQGELASSTTQQPKLYWRSLGFRGAEHKTIILNDINESTVDMAYLTSLWEPIKDADGISLIRLNNQDYRYKSHIQAQEDFRKLATMADERKQWELQQSEELNTRRESRLTEEQKKAEEDALSAKEQEIIQLKKEIEDLKQSVAYNTQSIQDTGQSKLGLERKIKILEFEHFHMKMSQIGSDFTY